MKYVSSNLFIVLACHQPVLDGFDQPFQASVQVPLASAINKSQQLQNKFLGTLRIKPGAAGREARMLPLFYAASPV